MKSKIYEVLLIDNSKSNYHQITKMLWEAETYKFNLTWAKTKDEAILRRSHYNYDAYLINYQEKNLLEWTNMVAPSPVIALISQEDTIDNNLIDNPISHYFKYDQLTSILLENCLHLIIKNSQTKQRINEIEEQYTLKLRSIQEQKTNQNKELLNTIFDHSNNGILIIDKIGIIYFINERGANLLNQPINKLIGNYLWIPIINKDTTQIQVVNQQNKLTTLEMNLAAITWQKQPASVVMIKDITQEVEKEAQLQRSEARYRRLYEKTPAMLHRVDPDCHILDVSDQWLETLGYTKEEVIGKKTVAFLTPKSYEKAINVFIPRLFVQGFINDIDLKFVRKNGEIIDVLLSAIVEKDEEENIESALAVLVDVTEKKQQERKIKEYQENLEKLVAQKTKELHQSETMFSHIAENINSIFWVFEGSRVIYINPAYEQIWGKPRNLIYEDNTVVAINSIHPDDREKVLKNILEQKVGELTAIEYRIFDAQGELHWLYTRSFSVCDAQDKVVRIVSISDDITQRKEYEKSLNEAKEKYESILKNTSEGFWIIDAKENLGKILEVNDALCAIVGYSREELLTMSIQDLEVVEKEEETREHILKILQTGGDRFETKHRRKNGKIIDVLISVNYIPEANYFCSFITDITTQKQTELALRESEKSYVNLTEAVPVGLYINDAQGNCIYINQKCAELLDITLEECLGTGWANRIHPDDLERMLDHWQQCVKNQSPWEDEYRFIHQDGTIVWVYAQATFQFNEKGENTGSIGCLTDITQRKEIEEALKESEATLKLGQKIAHLGNWKLNPTTGQNHWSEEVYHVFGQNPETFEVNPENFFKCVHPEDQDFVRDMFQQMLLDKQSKKIEYRLVTPDNQIKYVQEYADTILDQKGELMEIIGTVQDISELKLKEEALQKNENLYRMVVEDQNELICRFLIDGTITFVNPAYCRYFNRKAEDLINKNWLHLIPLEQQEDIRQYLAKLAELTPTNPVFVIEQWVIVNGQKRWQEWTDRAIFDDWGRIKEIQGLGVDITERKIAEEALKESEASFRSIFENAAIGMALADLNGHCYKFNDKFLEFLGYYREELSTNSFDTITHPKDISLSKKYFQESLNGLRDYFSFDKRFICKNGVAKWGNISVSLVRNAQQKSKYFIVVVDDISARKEAQITLEKAKQAAEDANLAKSQFLANMSHELRTPLNAILGFTQLMARSRQLNPQHQEYLQIINRAGEHLLSLINDILDLSRIEAGRVELYQETFDLHNLLDAVQKMLAIKAKAKNLELVLEVEESISYCINTDPNKLRSVLINILGNAIKFTNQGRVILRARGNKINDHQVNLTFQVEDTGVGIHPQDLKNLFNVFVQAKSGQQSGEGSGLGLAISQRFVNLMGGKIKVNSEVDKGSIFTFNIIAGMERNSLNSALTLPNTVLHVLDEQSSIRVLIVEDKEINRQFLKDLLSTTGFEIREGVNGEEAIALWQTWQPELILMDIRMPVMNGYQAIREIRRLESTRHIANPVKIIAVTASVLTEEKHLILEAGCDDFIAKPVRESELFSKIAHHLDVSYVYDSESVVVTQTPSDLKADDLLIMPPDWREELYKAAIAARSKKILQLINEIPVENKGTIESLTKMVQQLDFEKIMATTQIIQQNKL